MKKIIPVIDIDYDLKGDLIFTVNRKPTQQERLMGVSDTFHEVKGLYALWYKLTGQERVTLAKRHFIHHKCDDGNTRLFAPFMVEEDENLSRPVYERHQGRWRMMNVPAYFFCTYAEDVHWFKSPSLWVETEYLN